MMHYSVVFTPEAEEQLAALYHPEMSGYRIHRMLACLTEGV